MNYDFKKLSAVEQVSEMSDNANVLIEDNGKIKRAPNVSSSWDALKNKPFYEEIERTTILDECSINMAYLDGWDEFRTPLDFNISINEPIVTGQKYKVLFDGVEYEGTAYEDEGYHALGMDLYGRQEIVDGMYFGIVFSKYEGDPLIVFTLSDIGPNHTIAIYKETSTVHKIDKKFIPFGCDAVLKGVREPGGIYTYESLPSGTFDKIKNKLLNKEPIIILFMVTYISDDGHIEYGCHIAYDIDTEKDSDWIYVYSYDYGAYINADDTVEYD